MRKMKDSGIEWIGYIPEDWNLIAFRHILKERNEKNEPVTTKERLSLSIDKGVTLYSEKTTNLDRFKDDFSQYKIAHKGDLVLNSMNMIVGAIGISNYYGCVSPAYYTYYDELENHLTARYCKYLFSTSPMKKVFFSLGKGILSIDRGNDRVNTCRLKVSRDDLRALKLPLPTVKEQEKIVDYLDKKCASIDSIIDKEQKLIEKLKEYKQSLITETVTKGLNPDAPTKDSGIEWIGDIPKHWNSDTVYRCIKFEGGSQPDLSFFINEPRLGYVRLIQNRDYKTDDYATYVPENMVKKFCTKDDVMIGRYGPPLFVIHRGLEGAYNVAMFKAIPINLDREFMYFYLQNLTLVKYVESFSERTAGQSGVNPIIFKKYPIFIPPMNEQKLIADYLYEQCDKIDKNISKRQALIEKLNEYKKSLIYEVVTGKIEV